MKNKLSIIVAVLVLFSVVLPVSASTVSENVEIQARIDKMQAAASNHSPEVYTAADRYNTNVQEVMRLNGITREAAIARIARALIAQKGNMPKPPVLSGYGIAYDSAPHALRSAYSRMFYAGINLLTNQPTFTVEQRHVLLDSFWYCSAGQEYVYSEAKSYCK